MQRVQIQFTDEQVAALHERARASGRPIAGIVREAVDAWIAADERQSRFDRALAAIGSFRSGLSDLSTNHDEYFVEAVEAHFRQ
jgi:hypothetical protein